MMKLVNIRDLKSLALIGLQVQVLLWAPLTIASKLELRNEILELTQPCPDMKITRRGTEYFIKCPNTRPPMTLSTNKECQTSKLTSTTEQYKFYCNGKVTLIIWKTTQ